LRFLPADRFPYENRRRGIGNALVCRQQIGVWPGDVCGESALFLQGFAWLWGEKRLARADLDRQLCRQLGTYLLALLAETAM
jgi:hypothetical protein